MPPVTAPLAINLLRWLAHGRTSCPRLTIWEDALDDGLVARVRVSGEAAQVALKDLGRARLLAYDLAQPQHRSPETRA